MQVLQRKRIKFTNKTHNQTLLKSQRKSNLDSASPRKNPAPLFIHRVARASRPPPVGVPPTGSAQDFSAVSVESCAANCLIFLKSSLPVPSIGSASK